MVEVSKRKTQKNHSNKTKSSNKSKSVNKTKNKSLKKENVSTFLDKCLDDMKKKQEDMLLKYNFGLKDNKFIFFPYKKKFYMYNDKKKEAFFEGQFQIIGTYSNKSNTWRFAWANRYIPNDLKKSSLKLKDFGEANGLELLSQPKVKDDKMGLVFTAVCMKLSNGKGYYVIPADKEFPDIYLVFTRIKKIKKSINKIIKDNSKNNLSKKLRYEKLVNQLKK
jgi:hypothetical protein